MKYSRFTRDLSALLLLITLGLLWSFSFIIARFVTTHGVNPIGYSFLHTVGTAILLFCIVKLSRKKLHWSGKNLQFYFLCGLIGIALPNTNKYFVAAHLPAGLLGIIVNSSPLWIYLFSIFFRVERFFWGRFAGVVCGVAGILLIVLSKTTLDAGSTVALPWLLAALITPCCYALTAIYITKHAKSADSVTLISGMLLAASVMLIPLTFGTHNFYRFHLPLSLVDGAILLEIILAGIGYVILFKLLRLVGPVYYSLVDGIVVIATPLLGALFFSETLGYWLLAGAFLILLAIILVGGCKNCRIEISE